MRIDDGFFWTIAAGALLATTPFSGRAQIDRLDRDRGHIMLEHVRSSIARQYYDSTYHGVDLAARFAAMETRIQQATSFPDLLASVAQLTLDLGDSHTFFLPPRLTTQADYGWDLQMIGDSAYVVKVSAGSDAERQSVHAGDRVLTLNGYRPTRQNLWQLQYLFRLLRPQRSLQVALQPPDGDARQLDLAARVKERRAILDLTGLDGGSDIMSLIRESETEAKAFESRVVRLNDSVVVWKMPTFNVDANVIDRAIDMARKGTVLVLDLRGDGGGLESAMLELIGRLFANDVKVGTLRSRKDERPLVARGAGTNAFTGRLFVLVDSRSASASEITARVVQLNHRGAVFGDRTAGAVMRGRVERAATPGERTILYGVSVSESDIVMSDGGRLEGNGVMPDSVLLPTATELRAKADPVLSHVLALAGMKVAPAEAGALFQDR
jgi:carboxyl-terminal processing protease